MRTYIVKKGYNQKSLFLLDIKSSQANCWQTYTSRSFLRCIQGTMLSFISLFLAFILLTNAVGYYPLFMLRKWQVHTEVKSHLLQTIDYHKLQKITITPNTAQEIEWEWTWEEGNKEFIYQGNRYDVIHSETESGVTHYYCFNDTAENELVLQLEEEIKKQLDEEQNPLHSATKKMLKAFSFLPFTSSSLFYFSPIPLVLKNYIWQADSDCCGFYSTISPPPKQLV